jgi:hypothetical protein
LIASTSEIRSPIQATLPPKIVDTDSGAGKKPSDKATTAEPPIGPATAPNPA